MAKKEYTFEEICSSITAGKFAPVYVLMGEEPYFIDKITDLLIEKVLDEADRDFNQTIMYGADVNVGMVINAARRFPMMSEYQLVVVKEAQAIRDIEQLANYVNHPLKSTVLVINHKYKTIDGRKKLAVATEKNGILFESKKIYENRMPAFITSLLRERAIGVEPKAAQMLADFLGNDLSRLNKELDKLAILLSGKAEKRITPELVEQNIGISKEYNNFELQRAIAVKDILKANRIIQYFEKDPKNNPIQMTLSILFNYFSNLLICHYSKDKSENGIMNALGLRNTFAVKEYMQGLRNYSALKVFNLISEIRTTDARSKGVENPSTPSPELLKMLVYQILH
ncbi:MAG: DNA polymerase III subunit delta [Tannerellaceae bacterium]|jgi:DNA polymerase-3 subunit delta|nr:DNA polymerase III subunit delta [Tannerellaceae bacterium]